MVITNYISSELLLQAWPWIFLYCFTGRERTRAAAVVGIICERVQLAELFLYHDYRGTKTDEHK